ncbi:MAG: hypothetical protein M1818_004217 [Claussenomyces sp. TS43310]|nr:MAG: hypothetical protein M1818_004217 [Claussenomyces sp. TS43310]
MPILIPKARRKRVTPIANLHENDVWQRTFKLLGLEPLTSFVTCDWERRGKMAAEASEAAADAPGPWGRHLLDRKLTFFDLPDETQKHIFTYRYRWLAAQQLYRNFHIVFPDEDDPSYESPIDGLAGGLDTLATSDYNYAQFLKEIKLDTLSGGDKGERAYRHYTYDVSCGKFMNTLFLLTLRKARALESFRWNLRIEISRPVFKALHQIPSLQHLHVRVQAGPSAYERPPPLPSLEEFLTADSASSSHISSVGPLPPLGYSVHGYSMAKHGSKHKSKNNEKEPAPQHIDPPTFGGFKDLQTLSILAIDTLDYVSQIRLCIQRSSSTLKKLKLSFSEPLARQARKPPPVEDPDESDQEIDEFGNIILPPPPPPPLPQGADDTAGPIKVLKAEEQRLLQEAVLGHIFDLRSASGKNGDGGSGSLSDEDEKTSEDDKDAREAFVAELKTAAKKMMKTPGSGSSRSAQQKEALAIIEKAARKFVESSKVDPKAEENKQTKSSEEAATGTNSDAKTTPALATAGADGEAGVGSAAESNDAPGEKASSMFDKSENHRKLLVAVRDGLSPDDIDVERPENEADPGEFEEVPSAEVQTLEKPVIEAGSSTGPATAKFESYESETTAHPISPANAMTPELRADKGLLWREDYDALKLQLDQFLTEAKTLSNRIDAPVNPAGGVEQEDVDLCQRQLGLLQEKTIAAQGLLMGFKEHMKKLGKQSDNGETEATKNVMTEYIRSTRGLALRSLAIYLIPIKASVLTRAIDINVLERITLLNVGLQTPFWNVLQRANTERPLPLRKIYTDHVTTPFLILVKGLKSLTELFLLERSSKTREYSFAGKTTVTIDDIRKMVLKKHVGTLKKLMIKNEYDYAWDADEKTLKLLCKKGKQLEELALSFGVRAVHTFNQFLPGLTNLRAMHIITFRSDDTCHWVIREIRKFAVDSVSHNSNMKLEYIALENTVERLVRRARKPKRDKGKGKDKQASDSKLEVPTNLPDLLAKLYPEEARGSDDSTDDEYDDEDLDLGPGLKLETLEGVRFYDIFGVRIFRKDIMAGRL